MSILEKLFHGKEIADKQKKYKEYQKKFKELGIELLYTDDVSFKNIEKIYKHIILLFDDNPELPKGFLRKLYVGNQKWYERIECVKRERTLQGSTRWFKINNELFASIFISTDFMDIENMSKREQTIPIKEGMAIESVLTHEFAHVMEYYIIYKIKKWDQNCPELSVVREAVTMSEIIDNKCDSEETYIVSMCEEIIKKFGVTREFRFRILDSVGQYLGALSTRNYQEFYAEALAQYYCSDEPEPIAKEIYEKFQEIKSLYLEK